MVAPLQGEVWWAEAEDKRRPVLIVTRSVAVPMLSTIVIAPVTRSIRGIPTEVAIAGLEQESVATFDNLQIVQKRLLTSRVGERVAQTEICRALDNLADC